VCKNKANEESIKGFKDFIEDGLLVVTSIPLCYSHKSGKEARLEKVKLGTVNKLT
jgi:hypothetical protein